MRAMRTSFLLADTPQKSKGSTAGRASWRAKGISRERDLGSCNFWVDSFTPPPA